ncbi:MAG TPA: hypothetical protein VHO06_08255 [Polyangia bacterium]|nr:hypothetical protein [Polyangia bacterium]
MAPHKLLWPALGALLAACTTSSAPTLGGTCAVDDALTAGCNVTPDGGAANLGLVGYACTGAGERPDLEQARYVDGVPQGIICADKTPLPDGGVPSGPQNYCCTAATTTCVYNPVSTCGVGTYGYECQDINRPESYNPDIICGQGVPGPKYVDYCCSGISLPPGCAENDALGCAAGLVGWNCPTSPAGLVPKGQDLADNKSRADQYYLVCSVPTLSPSGKVNNFCCYPPAAVPPGGACVEDNSVPGCAPGRFGFSCYGEETPSDDFPPMNCPDPGVPGTSSAGYPASLYCCDYE